jgi:cephalosporin hydroxylase
MSGPTQLAIEQRIMTGTRFRGVPALKNPCDAWVYQELIHEQRPDVIVEIGNHAGGALLYLATLCDIVDHGEVIGVDRSRRKFDGRAAEHPRVQLVNGRAVESFNEVAAIVDGRSALVIEDSAHTFTNTLAVLSLYGVLVRPGGYLICEDGVMPEVAQALDVFLDGNDEWEVDRAREWPFTWNPGGYLRRVK